MNSEFKGAPETLPGPDSRSESRKAAAIAGGRRQKSFFALWFERTHKGTVIWRVGRLWKASSFITELLKSCLNWFRSECGATRRTLGGTVFVPRGAPSYSLAFIPYEPAE